LSLRLPSGDHYSKANGEFRDSLRHRSPARKSVSFAAFATLRNWEYFEADTGKDSAREIREYFIPKFSDWKNHDSYQEAFQRLLSDLKASDANRGDSGGRDALATAGGTPALLLAL